MGENPHARKLELLLRTIIDRTYSHVDGRDLLAELHPRKTLDIKRRVDAVETWFEGDWLSGLRDAVDRAKVYLLEVDRMAQAATDPHHLATKLSAAQRAELLHYESGEGFMPPLKASCARYMWHGIVPRGFAEPVFLLKKAHGTCLYSLSPLGLALKRILESEQSDDD